MADHLSSFTARLITSESLKAERGSESSECSGESSRPRPSYPSASMDETVEAKEHDVAEEEEALIQSVECRICQEEDTVKNLEVPCACSGSLKYAHRKCVQRWCNEKGDITCEICHQSYQPGYTSPLPPPVDDTVIDITEDWPNGVPLDLNDPRIMAMVAADHADYDDYSDSNPTGASFCRSAALILMALLLLRHALNLTANPDEDDDPSTFFSLFLLRATGFLLPCYIMAWAISILQRRRQRQEEAALAAAEVAFMVHGGQHGGLHFTMPHRPFSNPPPLPSSP